MVNGDSNLIQLVYASAATVPFDDEALETLLAKARHNNQSLQITGVLLFKDNTFFQVLEGQPQAVESLYHRIQEDGRHGNVLLLVRREIEERNFGAWSMGYVRDPRAISELPGFVDFFTDRTFLDLVGDRRRMEQILEGFRRGRWRRSASEELTTS